MVVEFFLHKKLEFSDFPVFESIEVELYLVKADLVEGFFLYNLEYAD